MGSDMMLEPVQFLFNESINVYLQSLGNPFIDKLFLAITNLGSQPVYFLLASVIFWCFSKRTGIRAMYVILLSASAAIFTKNLFSMPRPPVDLQKIQIYGFGFPSLHAQVSAGFWTYLGGRSKNRLLIVTGTAAVLLISLSRIYLGVHYGGDVIGGILFGVAVALIFFKTEAGVTSKLHMLGSRSKYLAVAVLTVILISVAFLQRELLREQTEIGLVMASGGFGYLLEEEHIRFEDAKNDKQRIKRALVGISVLSAIYLAVSLLVLINPDIIFFRYAVLGFATTFIVPLVFVKIEGLSDRNNPTYSVDSS